MRASGGGLRRGDHRDEGCRVCPRTRRRTGGRMANKSEWRAGWMEMPGDASPHRRRARVRAAGSLRWVRFPRRRPGPPPCSLAVARGRAAGRAPLDRRSRPPGPASPRPNSPAGPAPPAGRMRSALPLGVPERRALGHSTSGGRSRLGLGVP